MEHIQLVSYVTTIIANVAVVVSAIIAINQLIKMRKSNELSQKSLDLMKKTLDEEHTRNLEDHTRNLRQSTIEFYNELNKETKELIDDVMLNASEFNLKNITEDDVLHRRVRRYLSLMERFSVGINSHMYDITVFDRMQGKTTLIMYDALKPYIDYISEKYGTFFYGDFIKVIEELKKRREIRRNAGYSEAVETFSNHV